MNRCIVYHCLKSANNQFKYFPSSSNSFVRYKFISSCVNRNKFSKVRFDSLDACNFIKYRPVFSSSLQKSDGNVTENSGEKCNKDVANDEEFQNILKDFAKDFDVNEHNEKILDDIKKSLHDPSKSNSSKESNFFEAHSSSSKVGSQSAIEDKYQKFSDTDSVIIPSYEELKTHKYSEDEITYNVHQEEELNVQVSSKRGLTGVFDLAELVEILRQEKLMDIAVISVPKELHYTDYLVLTTARSQRHSDAVAEHLIKLYKMKKDEKDPFVTFEGGKKSNWKALDMGNIVLHIFLEEARNYYDIESLWLFDSKYDSGGTLTSDPLLDSIEEHLAFFNSLQDSTPKEEK